MPNDPIYDLQGAAAILRCHERILTQKFRIVTNRKDKPADHKTQALKDIILKGHMTKEDLRKEMNEKEQLAKFFVKQGDLYYENHKEETGYTKEHLDKLQAEGVGLFVIFPSSKKDK